MTVAKLYDLARMTTATTGAGTITLGSAVSGFLSFADSGVSDGETVYYAISDGSSSETGTGVYTTSGTTLSRSVIKSTDSDSAINLTGSAQVMITPVSTQLLGVKLPDSDASHELSFAAGSNLTADRTLTVNTGDANRALTLGGDVTINANPITTGTHTVWIPAGAMTARDTNGAESGSSETSTNKVMLSTLDFDTSTQEFAQFSIRMPASWDEGTVTFAPVWSHAATTTNFGVVWALQGVALSDGDAADAAFGTEQTSTDTGGTTNDIYQGPTSSAITIAGTPAANDYVVFQAKRNVANGSDDMAIDARLHGIALFVGINGATD